MAVYWDDRKGKRGTKGARGWWYRFIVDGRRHEGRGYEEEEDAQDAERRERRILRGLETRELPTTLREIAIEYFRQCEIQNTKNHFDGQWYRWNNWLSDLGPLRISQITPVTISQRLRHWAKAQSNATANRNLDFLKTILRTGLEQGLITYTDDLHRILRVKRLPVDRAPKYIPPREDILKVYLACNQRDRCLLDVYLGTLARKRELFDLEWISVDLEKRTVILTTRKTRGGNTKKTIMPMTADVRKALTWVDQNRLSDRWVFPSTKTKEPYNNRANWFGKICKEAGVPRFSFHNLRHYSSNLAADRGAAARQSQELLRHDNMTTTNTYLQGLRGVRPETVELVRDPLGMADGKKSYSNRIRVKKHKRGNTT